jgi:hypothetical protein
MEWVESTCRTVRCSKRATKVAEANLHELSPVTGKTVVAIKVIAAAIVAHVVAVVTAVTEAATVVPAVATVSVEVKMTEAAIEAQGANDVTPTMIVEDHDRIVLTAQSVQNVQTVTTKAAEIVAQGDPPVVMMVAADDRVRLADAKLSK